MTTIVKGHGSLPQDDTDTFVPVGTTIRFYSDFDVNLGTTAALVAIANGAQATAKETITGTGLIGDVANYAVWTQDDGFMAKWLAMGGESGIPIKWVGTDIADGTRLCDALDTCAGTHSCTGVLGTVTDTDIVILACRGFEGDLNQQGDYHYGTDTEDPLHNIEFDNREYLDKLMAVAKTDPATAESQVDALPQGTIALLVNWPDFDTWQKARHLKDLAVSGDFTQIIGHLTANSRDLDAIMQWLDDIPSYGAALDSAVTATPVRQMQQIFTSASPAVQHALDSRPGITAVIDEGDWTPDDSHLDTITKKNGENVKNLADGGTAPVLAGGLLVLIGDGHDPVEARSYVRRQGDFEQGTLTVTKGGAFSKGSVDVNGISTKAALVETAIGAFSDKKVKFV